MESELLVWVSSILTELRKNGNAIFLNNNLETCYNFHNVSFKFFINATVIVKEFDLLLLA